MSIYVFEGLDGSGKSTVIEATKEKLETSGYEVLVVRQPGGSSVGEELRNILKNKEVTMSTYSEAVLLGVCRQEAIDNIKTFRPDVKEKRVVLIDRWIVSIIYQYAAIETSDMTDEDKESQRRLVYNTLEMGQLEKTIPGSKLILIHRNDELRNKTKTYANDDRFEGDRERMEYVENYYKELIASADTLTDTQVFFNNNKSKPYKIAKKLLKQIDREFNNHD